MNRADHFPAIVGTDVLQVTQDIETGVVDEVNDFAAGQGHFARSPSVRARPSCSIPPMGC